MILTDREIFVHQTNSEAHNEKSDSEGLVVARIMMSLSSMAPLFILMLIRGGDDIPWYGLEIFCVAMICIPLWCVVGRYNVKQKRKRTLGKVYDSRDHIFIYLFAVLSPLYSQDIEGWRDIMTFGVSLIFIVYIFFYLDLYYINIFFMIKGFRIYTVYPPENNQYSGKEQFILITRRKYLKENVTIKTYRISNAVHIERGDKEQHDETQS